VIKSGYDASHIAADTDLVVVGNVSRSDNPEAVATVARALPFISLPEALRLFFFPQRRLLTVTGTHGKTTTSGLLSWMLHAAGRDPSFFIGGVTRNFDSNYRLGGGAEFVVEGDEYDTAYFDKVPKFWHYPSTHATINNVEFDHADIYPNIGEIEHVFSRFAEQVDAAGSVWVNGDDERAVRCARHARARVRTFGLGASNDLRAEILGSEERGTIIRVTHPDQGVTEGRISTMGVHNVRNFLGATGLATAVGVELRDCLSGADTYAGVKKRQEVRGVVNNILVVDDFAHHPTAVRETLAAIRLRFPRRRIWAAFEAKSNTSRRAVFQDDYPAAFGAADVVILSEPWRKDSLPDEQLISIPRLAETIRQAGTPTELIPDPGEIAAYVAERIAPGDLFVGLSGSAFGNVHQLLLQRLSERFGQPIGEF
jgi:UDP-N-acetylmuramate: L-alanyl-gamma-D-glutamyl-meso-diaminopimelate ligase